MGSEVFNKVSLDEIDLKEVGIGLLGYGFMGKAHSNAFKKFSYMCWPPPAIPKLIAICGRTEEKVKEAAIRYGFEGYYTDWKKLVEDPRIEIFDNASLDKNHCAPSIAAAEMGKHVVCEKPLAMNLDEAKRMCLAVKEAGVKNMCGFNYRFLPAVRLAKDIIDKGIIGKIYEYKARYFQHYGANPDELVENIWYAPSGPGVLLGLGSHIIDMGRFLIGEISSVFGHQKIFNETRIDKAGSKVEIKVDESFAAILEFENGATGVLEGSYVTEGRKNQHTWEINGSKGSIVFDLEHLNYLKVCLREGKIREINGFTEVSVTDSFDPYSHLLWPPGHMMGWEDGHVSELLYFVDAVVNDKKVEPYGATFLDGYMVQVIMDAIKESSINDKKIKINKLDLS